MMAKNVGQGSQYLWTYRDAGGDFLDCGQNYKLHILPNIPAKNFWSVVVYDALSLVKVSRRLGHSSPVITLGVYAHLFGEVDDGAAVAIEKVLK